MTESKCIENRSELLFLYDCRDSNPNGDPLDENKPRIDEETGINIVTDVRLKRTIRDYLQSKNMDVFVKEEIKDGKQKTREERIKEIEEEKKNHSDAQNKTIEGYMLEKYIDLRLFGATLGLRGHTDENNPNEGEHKKEKKGKKKSDGKSIAFTGPVQFKFGRSLHKVKGPVLIKGTTVLPSQSGKMQGTFTETWVLPYSLIGFYGIINENAAKTTRLTEEDVKYLLEGMWNGTKNLISRSKVGQNPRLLLRIVYKKDSNFHIGDLDKKIKIQSNKRDEEIREIRDITLDLSDLISALESVKNKIEKIEYKVCTELNKKLDLKDKLSNIVGENNIVELQFDNEESNQ